MFIIAGATDRSDEVMKTRHLLLITGLLLSIAPLSANRDCSRQNGTSLRNPIVIISQIRDVSIDGDTVTIHVYREPHDIVAAKWLRVRAFDGRLMYAEDLQAGDNVQVDGDLDHQTIYIRQVILQMRVEYRP